MGSTASEFSANETTSLVSVVPLPRPNRSLTALEQLAQKKDAKADDWDTEVLSEAADQQLGRLAQLLEKPDRIDSQAVGPLVNGQFTCQSLRPNSLADVYRQGPLVVRRPPASAASADFSYAGAAGFAEALRQWDAALGSGRNRHAKFKLFQIQKQPDHFVTRLYLEASNHSDADSRQQTATWLCQWNYPAPHGGEAPRLLRVALEQYEEAHIAIPGGHLMVDCTQSVLGGNDAYRQQIVPGINHWVTRIPREFMSQFGHHGLAVGDVNGDGLDDLYVCDAGGLPNRLYVQQPDGTAVDMSGPSGMNLLEESLGALLVDLDNDGDQDLAVATEPVLVLAENDGEGHFTLRARLRADTDPYSLCAADYDADGDLDIYVCGYNARQQDPVHRGLPFPLPYDDANNGGKNFLWRNDGEFRFADVTDETGLDENNRRFSLAAAWEDFDNDGDLDLYVANDFGRNNLYRNDGGHFTDIAAMAGVEDQASGMSVSWGDPNRDGRMDLYVGNMFSAAGNRISYQRRFADGLAAQTVSSLRRMARGNTLFMNASQGATAEFHDASQQEGVAMGRWAWASKFTDLNTVGWQDLIVANGYVTGDESADL